MAVWLEYLVHRTIRAHVVHYGNGRIGQCRILECQRLSVRVIAGQCDTEKVLALAPVIECLFGTDEGTVNLTCGERLQHIGIGTERTDVDRRFAGFLQGLAGSLGVFQIDGAKLNSKALAGEVLGPLIVSVFFFATTIAIVEAPYGTIRT